MQGEVLEMGTYNELLKSGIDFAALLKKDKDNETEEARSLVETGDTKQRKLFNTKELNNCLSQSYDPSTLLGHPRCESEDSDALIDSDVKISLKRSKISKSLHSLSGRTADKSVKKARSQISIVKSVDNLALGVGSTLSLDDHIAVSIS